MKTPRPRRPVLLERAALTIVALLASGVAARAQEPVTAALLPFENVSGRVEAQRTIMPIVEKAVGDHGYRLLERDKVEAFLERHRVRNTGQMSRADLLALRRELGARFAVVGSVAIFNDSPTNPQWGLSSRLLDTESGAITWAGSAGLTGDDFTIALGLGTVTSSAALGEKTVTALFHDCPRAGEAARLPAVGRSSWSRLFGLKADYRSPTLDSDPPKRVAVVPFENVSERKGAGLIVTDIFTTVLARSGRFEVVEPGTVSEALAATGVLPFGTIDFDTLRGLRERLGVDAVILGTVFTYSEGLKQVADTSPEVSFDARMLDAATGRILWIAEQDRNGDDSQIALHFGKIRAVVPLLLKVADEMVRTL